MAANTILESTATFESQAKKTGLDDAWVAAFNANSMNSLSKLAYAITTPGTAPTDAQITNFLYSIRPSAVPTLSEMAAVKRLLFEAQTFTIANLRASVQSTEDSASKKIAPAERASRIAAQRLRLSGLDLSGPLEPSFWLYDQFTAMLESNELKYIAPNKCLTRQMELSGAKPEKQIKLDEGKNNLVLKDSHPEKEMDVGSDLALFQAMNRRALAMDLVGMASYDTVMKWHNRLFAMMSQAPAPGFTKPGQAQLLRADRQAFLRLAEMVPHSMQITAAGILPLDEAYEKLHTDVTVTYHMLPLPVAKTLSQQPMKTDKTGQDRKPAPYARSEPMKGKGKGKSKKRQPMPTALHGMHHQTPDGHNICFNYNLGKCKDKSCKRAHVCCVPQCYKKHPQFEHESAQ